jgi:hypothetical protein
MSLVRMDEFAAAPAADAPRDAMGRFARGNPGRPVGTRNLVSARVARAILADFEANQDELLPRLRRWFLPQYVALVARLLPRGGEGEGGEAEALAALDTLSPAELAALLADAAAAVRREAAGDAPETAAADAATPGRGP